MMTGKIFFSPDKPRFWLVKLMNIIITLLPMEYRITLAVRHCRSSFCRQVGEKFIHTLLSSFLRFSPVLCPFIYTFSIIVRRCRKSPRFVLYLHIGESWSFSLPGTWSKVSSTKKNFVAKYLRQRSWFGKKFVPQTGYSSSEVNKYTGKLSFGSSRNTLRERLIKKEDFKRRYSRQFWNRVCKRDYVRWKEIL